MIKHVIIFDRVDMINHITIYIEIIVIFGYTN